MNPYQSPLSEEEWRRSRPRFEVALAYHVGCAVGLAMYGIYDLMHRGPPAGGMLIFAAWMAFLALRIAWEWSKWKPELEELRDEPPEVC